MGEATYIALSIRTSDEEILKWDRNRIIQALLRETNVDENTATEISLAVETQIFSSTNHLKVITTSLVRELVNANLIARGLEKERLKHDRLGVPLFDVENILTDSNKENANVPHGPEATNLTLAGEIKKEYALRKIFSKDVTTAHLRGDLHLHDLTMPDRPYSFLGKECMVVQKDNQLQRISFEQMFESADVPLSELGRFEVKEAPGYEVYDRNGWTRVVRIVRHRRDGKRLLKIRVSGNYRVVVTEDHPIIVANRDLVILAADLRPYEDVFTIFNESALQTERRHFVGILEYTSQDEWVYDITTESGTFFCNGILVHNCSGQSLEYVKKFGLSLPNAMSIAKPAKHAEVFLAHLIKFAAALQCHYAGVIGWDAINIFFAPFLVGKSYSEIKQLAQMLIYEFSQQAVARGGQAIFSLVHDEIVWVKEGDKIESKRIGDVVDQQLACSKIANAAGHEYTVENEKSLEVLSFNQAGAAQFTKISAFIRVPYKGKMFQIKTQHGTLQGVSGEHSVFVFDGEKPVPKRVEELRPNDYIIVPRKVNLPNTLNRLNIAEYYLARDESLNTVRVKYGKSYFIEALKQKFGRYFYSDFAKAENIPISRVTSNWFRTDKIPLKIYAKYVGHFKGVKLCIKGDSPYEIDPIIEITNELIRVLGYYVSEGTKHTKSGISICNMDPEILEDAYHCCSTLASYATVREVKENGLCNVYCNGIFAKLVIDLCENSYGKIIPYIIFNLSEEQKHLFLLSFWKGDGIKNPTAYNVEKAFCNSSKDVISGIALLSASLGKEFRVYTTSYEKESWNDGYGLTWVDASVRIVDHKLNRYVPGTHRKIRKRLAGFLEDAENCNGKFEKEIGAIKQLLNSDLGFSRVREITSYDYDGFIYDFSVKPTESFAGGVGLAYFHNTDVNLYWEIPKHFQETPAIGPGGEYTGKMYKDYLNEAQAFVKAIFEAYLDGDGCGRPFFFPKGLLHITEAFFKTPGHEEFLELVCKVSSKMGNPYFVFDRGTTAKISECCRLSFKLTDKDLEDAKYPWRMRYCALQNVTLNLPRVGLISKGDKVFDRITKLFNLAVKAHLQKQRFIKKILALGARGPLALLAMNNDGDPYLKLDRVSYLIGMVGLNELVKTQTGCEMHTSPEALKYGLQIIAHMKLLVDKASQEHNMHFVLEQSPAESTAHRFARLDLRYYNEKAREIVQGTPPEDVYYTNSTQLVTSADIDPITRVQKEGLFHPLIEAGALSHIFLGESQPDPKALASFVEKVFRLTKNDQIAFSPEFTCCEDCKKTMRGLLETCTFCGSKNVAGITRITGYFSKVTGWNKGKLAELKDRNRKTF